MRIKRSLFHGGVFLAAVVLPMFTITVELCTRMSRSDYFDPMPTWFHTALLFLVPLGNLAGWWGRERAEPVFRRLPALGLGIAAYYALAFAPGTPLAFVGLLCFGFGLLPLTPLISFVGTWVLLARLSRPPRGDGAARPRLAPWVFGGALLVLAADTPRLTTWTVLQNLDHGGLPSEWERSVLRTIGSERTFREAAYRGLRGSVFFGQRSGPNPETIRRAFYLTYGRLHTASAPRGPWVDDRRDLDAWDRDLGGTRVGQHLDDLVLTTSRYEAEVFPASGYGYGEWLLEFRNDASWRAREARLLLSLPSGGVVSRVTLWVDGEPREAAFGGREAVRQAYQTVAVRQRRDPLLVSWVAPGQVLAQCFPIPADGGVMRIRLGISFPLEADGAATVPHLLASNFSFDPDLDAVVWMDGPADLVTDPASKPAKIPLPDRRARWIWRASEPPEVWVRVPRADPPVLLKERLAEYDGTVVVTLSGEERGRLKPLADALWAYHGRGGIIIAHDRVRRFESGEEASRFVRGLTLAGGIDTVPALEAGFDLALQSGHAALWWIHGAQPLLLSSTVALDRLQARAGQRVDCRASSLGPVVNRVREEGSLRRWPGGVLALRGGVWVLPEPVEPLALADPSAVPVRRDGAARHEDNVRIAHALESAWREAGAGKNAGAAIEAMRQRAIAQQLVTPLTGAVVLETAAQYEANGLEPIDPETAPTFSAIPEPADLVFFLSLFALLAMLLRRR